MSVEEEVLDAIDEEDDDDEDVSSYSSWRRKERQRVRQKNRATIEGFLGDGRRAHAVAIKPGYYGELLIWALDRYLKREGWEVADTLGYRDPEPFYIDVNTDYDKRENLIMRGQLLIEKDDARFVVTIDAFPGYPATVQVQGPEATRPESRPLSGA
jgi:hypothetical protein